MLSNGHTEASGVIFHIMRFSLHDGPGIRTAVFFKGCPLSCWWCHNPESQNAEPEVLYSADRCRLCGDCAAICPHGAIERTGARVAVAGHTHAPEVEEFDGVLWVNPGSPSCPRGGDPRSVAVVAVAGDGAVAAEIVELP